MVETTNNDFHLTIKATNHWLPFINCSNITVARQKKNQRGIGWRFYRCSFCFDWFVGVAT
jgi:hypothetical protein